jgi:hypothetical protein
MFDALYGLFYLAALLIFIPALIWMIRLSGLRWIDLAAPRMRGIYHPDFFSPDRPPRPSRSEAEATQQQIAAYEQRLSELDESCPLIGYSMSTFAHAAFSLSRGTSSSACSKPLVARMRMRFPSSCAGIVCSPS